MAWQPAAYGKGKSKGKTAWKSSGSSSYASQFGNMFQNMIHSELAATRQQQEQEAFVGIIAKGVQRVMGMSSRSSESEHSRSERRQDRPEYFGYLRGMTRMLTGRDQDETDNARDRSRGRHSSRDRHYRSRSNSRSRTPTWAREQRRRRSQQESELPAPREPERRPAQLRIPSRSAENYDMTRDWDFEKRRSVVSGLFIENIEEPEIRAENWLQTVETRASLSNLRQLCNENGIRVSGNKRELLQRIVDFLA